MDFAMFMERYGYKALWYAMLLFVIVGIPIWLGYALVSHGFFTKSQAAFIVGLFIVASVIAANFGKFMNTTTSLFSRLGYNNRAKLFEDKKKIEREREKLKEEGGKLY
ncbi:hypothetical protein [Thermococcus sp.]|uniref:hypothetical protein n=1 Tax=Thermococcus sp. TaxID=35749 RepID=UPI002627B2E3|nr:hypothetical protein [Thermococcus sp.]